MLILRAIEMIIMQIYCINSWVICGSLWNSFEILRCKQTQEKRNDNKIHIPFTSSVYDFRLLWARGTFESLNLRDNDDEISLVLEGWSRSFRSVTEHRRLFGSDLFAGEIIVRLSWNGTIWNFSSFLLYQIENSEKEKRKVFESENWLFLLIKFSHFSSVAFPWSRRAQIGEEWNEIEILERWGK